MQVQMPHAWKEGTDIHPHLHWMKTTNGTGNVVWRLEYRWVPIGEVMDATWKESIRANTMPVTPDSNTAFKHLMTEFDDISGQGKQLSDMLLILLSRNANTAADTYTGASAFLEFDIHYEVDRLGSQTAEYVK
jgi:hypothetical protein